MEVFTTARVTGGEPWFWPDHVARLRDGAAAYGLVPPDPERLLAAVRAAVAGLPDARVRVTAHADGPPSVAAAPYAPPRGPWTLAPVALVSLPGDGPLRKTTDRTRYDEARARAPGADDALLVAPGGSFLETTVANVFLVDAAGTLLTPPAMRPLLPGIARARVLAAATALGFAAREADFGAGDAARARECFLTNALFVVQPVAAIEGIARFAAFSLARRLREAIPGVPPKNV